MQVYVYKRVGDLVEDDCTCNSEYMCKVIKRVSEATCKAYHWITCDQPCYIVMDNAGGHGIDKAIDEYVKI